MGRGVGGAAREERDHGEWLTLVCVLQSCLAFKKNSLKKALEDPTALPVTVEDNFMKSI